MFDTIKRMPDRLVIDIAENMMPTVDVAAVDDNRLLTGFHRRSGGFDYRHRWVIETGELQDDAEYGEGILTDLRVFINEVHGHVGLFYFWPPMFEVPAGLATGIGRSNAPSTNTFSDGTLFDDGTQFVNSAITRGFINKAAERGSTSIEINNLVINTAKVLYKGDQFSILHKGVDGRRYEIIYNVMKHAHSNASGIAEVEIYPALRANVIAGPNPDPVNFWRPKTPCRFVIQPEVDISSPQLGETELEIMEIYEVLY